MILLLKISDNKGENFNWWQIDEFFPLVCLYRFSWQQREPLNFCRLKMYKNVVCCCKNYLWMFYECSIFFLEYCEQRGRLCFVGQLWSSCMESMYQCLRCCTTILVINTFGGSCVYLLNLAPPMSSSQLWKVFLIWFSPPLGNQKVWIWILNVVKGTSYVLNNQYP